MVRKGGIVMVETSGIHQTQRDPILAKGSPEAFIIDDSYCPVRIIIGSISQISPSIRELLRWIY